jgi:hypothetical protein
MDVMNRVAMAMLVFCSATTAAHAGAVQYIPVESDESTIVDDLGDTFTRYAYSLDRWLKIETPFVPEITHRSIFSNFEGGFKRATVARLEYSFEIDGVGQTVTYHAMSGTEPDEAFRRLLTNINKMPSTPLSPASAQFDVSGRNVRAASIDDSESQLHGTETPEDGLDHSADAEIKGLRNLERDITDGVVAPNGSLKARVSKMPCRSCRTAFDEMTDLYPDMTVEVAYPIEESEAYKAFNAYRNTAFKVVRNNRSSVEPMRSLEDFQLKPPKPPCP